MVALFCLLWLFWLGWGQADCASCCNREQCDSAFNGSPGICCGWDDDLPSCCPARAFCVDSGVDFSCSWSPPPSAQGNACDQCCNNGNCAVAFNGRPGQCCGSKGGTTFCCPHSNNAQCDERQQDWVCTLHHKASGMERDPIIKGIAQLGALYLFCVYVLPVLATLCVICLCCCFGPRLSPGELQRWPSTGPTYQSLGSPDDLSRPSYGSTSASSAAYAKTKATTSYPDVYERPPAYAPAPQPSAPYQPPIYVQQPAPQQSGYSGSAMATAATAAGLAGFLGGEYAAGR
eukprot:g82144.t1